jgi:hypothetical protein
MLVARIVESSAGPFCRHPRSLFNQCRRRAGPLLLRGQTAAAIRHSRQYA